MIPGGEEKGVFISDGRKVPQVNLAEIKMVPFRQGGLRFDRMGKHDRDQVRFVNSLTNYFDFEDPMKPTLKEGVDPEAPYKFFLEAIVEIFREVILVSCSFFFYACEKKHRPRVVTLSFG